MNRTMLTATNTLNQLQNKMDVISHNIANVDSTGFKRKQATFTDLMVQQFQNQSDPQSEVGRLTPNGIRQGTGARLAQISSVGSLGSIKTTDRQLDMALTKEGQMFRVLVQGENGSEVQYTRDGAFYLTPVSETENMLVTSAGYPVLDENNDTILISAEANEFQLQGNGNLVVNGGASIPLGVSFVNHPQFLVQTGANLLGLPDNLADLNVNEADVITNLIGPARNEISMRQGALEQSNVDLSKEMTDLIEVQRSYQFQTRSISIADQMMGLVNGIR
jgi:flagellar basal-body rod protein FlgG